MNIIEEVRSDREDLARVLKKHLGIRKIVEDLYPDNAHFLFELLQNAEDAGATDTAFTLTKSGLIFEHNGRPFEPPDIYAITDIGEGTKANDDDKIGQFGIGFKAVFAYTESPRIWSSEFAFEISDLVLPFELSPDPEIGSNTRFEFPFNNPKKAAADAYDEIEKGLNDLSENTLLFLSSIESIKWDLPGNITGEVFRFPHSQLHIEVFKKTNGTTTASSHYLRFTAPVEGLEKQRIAIAFALDFLPKSNGYDAVKSLAEQFRIVPANPGRVAVFFPAEKEISGLRFHLHAPFVPELSRASIKETMANAPLFHQLASLVASSLHGIRDLKLLTADFLGVLPNLQDKLQNRYAEIGRAIIDEMNEKPLTPTYSKGHAPARHLLQARASLKRLLSLDDIRLLVGGTDKAPKWSIGAAQKNSPVDQFLSGLAIREWDIDRFVDLLEDRTSDRYRWDSSGATRFKGADKSFIAWLASKPDDWHQKLYALLADDYLVGSDRSRRQLLEKLKPLYIVRLNTGEYSNGSKCYFPTDQVENDKRLPQVAKSVFTSGKNRMERASAKGLLEVLGVRHVGEAERVEAVLKQNYGDADFQPSLGDLDRFIALVEKDAGSASLFSDYSIFKREDGKWGQPSQVYLDAPYVETGISAFYAALGEAADRVALAKDYQETSITIKRLVDFAIRVGVVSELAIEEVSCRNNPDAVNLVHGAQGNRTGYQIDRDYAILGLDDVIENITEALSLAVWRACINAKHPEWTTAKYRNNFSCPTNEAPSQLAVLLSCKKWVPQSGGTFVRPADAERDLLPDVFKFDSGWHWLKAIQFGESVAKQSAESRRRRDVAREMGFSDEDSLNDAKWFAELDREERQRFKTQYESKKSTASPEHEPANPERRSKRVQEDASNAPERRTEMRTRSVSIGRESVKKDTDPYLRQQYTNSDGETVCQVCKATLPFKLSDGTYYLEAVEFLPELKRRHYQNYLALCPNHAAMFQHANGSREMMRDDFLGMKVNELALILADGDSSVYFTKTHAMDIKAVILADESGREDEEYDEFSIDTTDDLSPR